VAVVGNKVDDGDDVAFLREQMGDDLLCWVTRSGFVKAGERGRVLPIAELEPGQRRRIDHHADGAGRIGQGLGTLTSQAVEFRLRNATAWGNDRVGEDLADCVTADAQAAAGSAADAVDPEPRLDLFLLAGQFPGTDHNDTLRTAVTYARAAEAAGFDGVWLAEHHFISYGVCPSATVLAGYLLGHTSRLRVGTAAAILSNRHPVALAEEANVLDAVSGGRFDLGVARGGPWVDLEVFGTGLRRFTHGFPEALDLLLATRSAQRSVRADGEHFRFREVAVVPRPPRQHPVWVAATSSSTVDVAARRGQPLLLGMHDDDAAKAAMLARYATTAIAAGHEPDGIGHASAHLAFAADSVEQAETTLRASLPGWLARTREYTRIDDAPAGLRDLDAYVEHLLAIHPIGPPQRCIERLGASRATTGARHLLLMVEGGGHPDLTLKTINRLGADVLPALRKGRHAPA
jgi:alkanesulfonate monooxygenase SsuD/methylene tetrahydromethanopterin reductase-like flavin-dependent oxidoreductase (luciferase family)